MVDAGERLEPEHDCLLASLDFRLGFSIRHFQPRGRNRNFAEEFFLFLDAFAEALRDAACFLSPAR